MLGRWTCKIHCASYIYFASHPGLTNLTRESATRQSALQSLESNLGKREHPSAHACGPLTARDEGIWTVDGSLLGSLVGLPSPPPSPPLCPQKPCSLVPLPSPQRASFCPTRNLRPRSWLLVSKLTQGPASCLRLVRCLQLARRLLATPGSSWRARRACCNTRLASSLGLLQPFAWLSAFVRLGRSAGAGAGQYWPRVVVHARLCCLPC